MRVGGCDPYLKLKINGTKVRQYSARRKGAARKALVGTANPAFHERFEFEVRVFDSHSLDFDSAYLFAVTAQHPHIPITENDVLTSCDYNFFLCSNRCRFLAPRSCASACTTVTCSQRYTGSHPVAPSPFFLATRARTHARARARARVIRHHADMLLLCIALRLPCDMFCARLSTGRFGRRDHHRS